MLDANDMDLVRKYAARNSEPAFETLVRRHVSLVYSVALRQVGNPAQAEEVTQAVFLILARKAARLRPDTVLAAWLHETARFASASFLRGESRRRRREQEAYMQSQLQESSTNPAWEQLAPLLDEAIGQLGRADRNAVVLRFFQNKSAREIAAALNVHESAAQKRLNRAVEKLRAYFLKRSVTVSAGALIGALSVNSVHGAPAHLAASIMAVSAKGTAVSTSTLTLIKGALKLMAWTKAKTAILAGGAIILAASTITLVVHHQHQDHRQPKPQPVAPAETDFPKTSWTFAGYADPQSALLSALWSLSTGDLETFLASLTPGERERQQQQLKIGAQRAGKSSAAFFTAASTTGDMPKTKGFRVLDQQDISDDEVILRISIEETGRGNQPKVVVAKMKKTGNEWKVDSIGPQ
jgi:RNA polymerase sigma factor (sigma-70 family)